MNQNFIAKLANISKELICDIRGKNSKYHISFIVRKNRIISIGLNNNWKTDPFSFYSGYRFSAIHSELDAIKRYGMDFDYSKCSLINVRIGKNNQLAMAKPCKICQNWINNLTIGFKDIYYTNSDGEFIRMKL